LDEDTQKQITELAILRDEHEKRLRELMRQQAHFGRSTPAETNIEIRDIEAKITKITADMAKLQIGASRLLEQSARAESTADLADISKQISEVATSVQGYLSTLIALSLRQQDTDGDQRKHRQRITNWFYLVITLLVIIDIVIRITMR